MAIRGPVLVALTCCGSMLLSAAWNPESGGPLLRSFTARSFSASPQNWASVQDLRGVLYFANTEGVLEFDGVEWRRIPVGAVVRSVALSAEGLVYVGAQGEFGFLAPDQQSRGLRYVSLVSRLPADARKFGDVWSVIPTPDGVYFGTYQGIFRVPYRNGPARVWRPKVRFGRLLSSADKLYVTSEGEGLLRLRADGGQPEPVPGGGAFSPNRVRAAIADPRGLIIAELTGLFQQKGGRFDKLAGVDEQLLLRSTVYSARELDADTLALATARNGLILLNRWTGATEYHLDKSNGLLSEYVTSVFRDREGALWLTSSAGIERLELAFTRFGVPEGLPGSTYTLLRSARTLYAGTDTALFRLETATGGPARFALLPGFKESVFGLAETAHGVLAATTRGIHRTTGSSERMALESDAFYDVALTPESREHVWAAGREGLVEMTWSGGAWKKGRALSSSGQEFRSVLPERGDRQWVGGRDFVLRVSWSGAAPQTQRFGAAEGIPPGFVNIYPFRGAPAFATAKGLLRFDGARFVPVGIAEAVDRPVGIVREAPGAASWITGPGYHARLAPNASAMPLLRSEAEELYAVLPEPGGVTWAAGADGVLVRHEAARQPGDVPFQVYLRRVQPEGAASVFEGAPGAGSAPVLPYRNNSLRFSYVAPFFEDAAKVEYQVRLEGADSGWSAWTRETRKDYTHLFEGSYRFRVRARNPHGVVSAEDSFGFRVSPPWYRTWPAWILYALLAAGAIYGVFRWRIQKLVKEKEKLEVTVAERTVEIRQQRDQIQVEQERSEALLLNILPAAVAAELKSTGTVQPQNYEEVTVCFTDFVGFTLSSEEMAAGALVSSLHEYFTSFDEITEEFGLEKLKTIGDAYMLVSGLPRPRRGHAVDAVLAALRMVKVVDELATRGEGAVWGVRIGLHTGPVAAGVVGVRKFAYDIWGNTVNLASRMESSGAPGEVNLSARTYELVRDFIDCEPRGLVQTKEKREMEMYFARGLRAELRDAEKFAAAYRGRFGEEPAGPAGQ